MRLSIPEGWPGLVGIALLVAGMVIVHAGSGSLPEQLGTASGGYLGTDFLYADERGPDLPISTSGAGEAHRAIEAVVADLGEDAYAERHLTLVGVFDSEAAARAAAAELALPRGAAAVTLDRLLLVLGLESSAFADPNPVVAELEQMAADVRVDGSQLEGSIIADLACTASSPAAAAEIGTALGDYGAALHYSYLRPPWVDPAISEDEALARSTYRRWSRTYTATIQSDPYLGTWAERFMATGAEGERTALYDELNEHFADRRDELSATEGVHAGVMALIAAQPMDGDPEDADTWGLELGRLMGALETADPEAEPTWFEQRHSASLGSVRAADARVEVGYLSFNSFPLGWSGLLAYLDENGCGDVMVRLSGYDDVAAD